MPQKQGNARWRTVAAILIVSGSAFGLAGCIPRPEHIEMPTVERREVNRGQLLNILNEQSKLQRLAAKLNVTMVEEGSVVPATVLDSVRHDRGKPYTRKFAQWLVNGTLYLSRDAAGNRNVSVGGEVEGANGVGFTLMGKNNAFWMLIPPSEEDNRKAKDQGVSPPRGKVLEGKFDADSLRPRDRYSIRPQDFADLLLMSEAARAINGDDVCFVETWPDYYVMNFLRADWPNHLYSKIWIERQELTVAIHQLYDSSGELVAEARFKNYDRCAIAPGAKAKIDMPTQVDFLWPRDRIMMHTEIEDPKLNGDIPARVFDPKRFENYPTEQIEVPPAH